MDERERKIREIHHDDGKGYCRWCSDPWPCNQGYLLARLEEVRGIRDQQQEAYAALSEEHSQRLERLHVERDALQAQVGVMAQEVRMTANYLEELAEGGIGDADDLIVRLRKEATELRASLSSSPAPRWEAAMELARLVVDAEEKHPGLIDAPAIIRDGLVKRARTALGTKGVKG